MFIQPVGLPCFGMRGYHKSEWGGYHGAVYTATLLFVPSVRKWGLASSLALMFLFTCYISYMILFARNLPCSCGGIFSAMTWPEHLIFNIFFTALAAIGLWFTYGNKLFIAINRTSRTPVKNSRQNS
jgi:hypothetical protein